MQRTLYALKLALPGRPRFATSANSSGTLRQYLWPCGCAADGQNDDAMNVASCGSHIDLITALSSRASHWD
jgi:hypothetical protein